MSVLLNLSKREIGQRHRTEFLAVKHALEKWLLKEWLFETGHLNVLYCKILQLASMFPYAKDVLIKILSEEDIWDGSMVYFVRRLEGLSENYDYKKIYEEIINLTEEIKMGF